MISSLRVIRHGAHGRYWNMAADESLLRLCRCPVLRLYEWSEPAVSLGYFEPSADVPLGRLFVRRYTGGGLVDHERDMTYSVVLPRDHPLVAAGTTASYERIHRTLHQAILEIGVNVQVAETADIEESHSCFLKAARFDLKQGERKIAGAAQRRSREGCLHQGSVLLENVDRVKLAGAIERLLGFMLAEKSEESVMTDEERALTQELERTRYATQQWNHAR